MSTTIKRSFASHDPDWERFTLFPPTLTQQPYNNQYNTCYNARLSMLRQRCLVSAKNKVVPRIIELMENVPSTAVGTVVKSTPGRPVSDTAYHSSYEGLSYLGIPFTQDDDVFLNYCGEGDSVVLEDESGRVELSGDDIDLHSLATGVVVAVEGTVGATGVMMVTKVHFPTMAPQDEILLGKGESSSSSTSSNIAGDAHVLLMSGLDCGGPDASVSLKREMLLDYITGRFEAKEGSNVARVIVAGGGCTRPIKPENASLFGNWNSGKKLDSQDKTNMTLPIRELDLFLGEMCAGGVPVDYIPGLHDPTNANWPQKPLHACLLPHSVSFVNMLSRSPNPYQASIGGKCFLGSDGYNITDLLRFISKKKNKKMQKEGDDTESQEDEIVLEQATALEALELTLMFNHMAPTGPDSLPTFPFKDKDPFVMENTPHVYFAGNCDSFETKLVERQGMKTRLICIPSFSKTGQAVLLNLKSLDCIVLEFGDVQDTATATNGDTEME
jgi:Archaeal DNA polymerase II, small subunit/DNA polymerase delta, subunit B